MRLVKIYGDQVDWKVICENLNLHINTIRMYKTGKGEKLITRIGIANEILRQFNNKLAEMNELMKDLECASLSA